MAGTEFTFNVNKLFKQVFGIQPDFKNLQKYDGYPDEQASTNKGASGTGNYMWDRFNLKYSVERAVNDIQVVLYKLPDATVVDISCSKNIIKTQLTKVKGSVKEFINIGDFELEFKGLMINYDSMTFPLEAQAKMKNFFAATSRVNITSKLVNGYGIFNMIVEDIKFPSMAGFANCQPFQIKCVSDEPIILEIP